MNKSATKFPLTFKSNFSEHESEGDKLTSSNHGLKNLSSKISNPNKSKQLFL